MPMHMDMWMCGPFLLVAVVVLGEVLCLALWRSSAVRPGGNYQPWSWDGVGIGVLAAFWWGLSRGALRLQKVVGPS